jgi:hypothetical protein
MGISRKDALERVTGLHKRIEQHLEKLERDPGNSAAGHWGVEVRGWVRQCEAVMRHLGKKTAGEWALRISESKRRLEVLGHGNDR